MFKRTNWQQADGNVASVVAASGRYGTNYSVVFTYKVNDHWCSGSFETTEPTRVGDSVAVDYDPADPDRNKQSLHSRNTHWALMGGVALFIGVYLALNLFSRTSH